MMKASSKHQGPTTAQLSQLNILLSPYSLLPGPFSWLGLPVPRRATRGSWDGSTAHERHDTRTRHTAHGHGHGLHHQDLSVRRRTGRRLFGRRLGEGTTPTPSGTSLIGRGGGGKAKGSEGEDGECGDGSEYGGSNIASRSCCRRTGAGYAVSAIDSHCDAPGDA